MTSTRNYVDDASRTSTFQVTANSPESFQGRSSRTLRSLSSLANELTRECWQYWRDLQLETRENRALLRENMTVCDKLEFETVKIAHCGA